MCNLFWVSLSLERGVRDVAEFCKIYITARWRRGTPTDHDDDDPGGSGVNGAEMKHEKRPRIIPVVMAT